MKTSFGQLSAVILLMTLFACTGKNSKINQVELIPGGKTYGGKVSFVSDETVTNLFPLGANDKYSMRIAFQIFEGLLKLDGSTLEIQPAIAENFEINGAGDVYTFTIRKGVFFHKDDCFQNKERELTPEDVKFSLDFACSGNSLVFPDHNFINQVKGGKAYFDSKGKSRNGVEGIKVNGNKVEIHLNQPMMGFENFFTKSHFKIFPKEALDKYGNDIIKHPVGTGPFKLKEWSDDRILIERNDRYWKKDSYGNKLPYLAQIEMTYERDKKAEILSFRRKEIDLVFEVPAEGIDHLLGTLEEAREGKNIKHKVETASVLGIEYLGFNHAVAPFDNPLVREAFALSIDQEELIINVLEGDGFVPDNGYVPYFGEYDNASEGYSPDIERARKLFAQAGYDAKHPFPKVDLYLTGEKGGKNHKIATGVKDQLKQALGIDLGIKYVTFEEREQFIKDGKAIFWKAGWIGETINPLDFLIHFRSGQSLVNDFHYSSPTFNNFFTNALIERDEMKRREWIRSAQNEIHKDVAVIPLLRDNMIVMYNVRVRGLLASQLDVIDFSEVFIKEPRD